MKFNVKTLGAVAVICSTLAVPANAAVINMGTINAPTSGTIAGSLSSTPFGPYLFSNSKVFGQLGSNLKITFTYTIPGMALGNLNVFGSYGYDVAGNNYSGSSNADSSGFNSSLGYVNGVASSPLTLASANLGSTSGTTTITNLSGGFLSFQSIFAGLLNSASGFQLSYVVGQVPLPAALPMFVAALAGIFGFARRQKKMAA